MRQMFEERRHHQQGRSSRISPIGWDKSYPLEPVQVSSYWLGQELSARTGSGELLGWEQELSARTGSGKLLLAGTRAFR